MSDKVGGQQEISDAQLVQQSFDDEVAFAELMTRYQDQLERYIRRRARATTEDIEDILQEVFVKVYVNLHDFDESLTFSAWIYRITHNFLIDWLRKRTTRIHDDGVDIEEGILHNIAGETDIEIESITGERAINVRKAIDQLSDQYKNIMILRFFEERDYGEISDILQIPSGTVAARISRAKKQLKIIITGNTHLNKF